MLMESGSGLPNGLFIPEIMTPEQFFGRRRDDGALGPVRRLMMAVLEDALRCFQNNWGSRSKAAQRQFLEAEQWLCEENGDGPFSFDTVCVTLGIEPSFLRRGLRDWRDQELGGFHIGRLARRSPVMRGTKMALARRPHGSNNQSSRKIAKVVGQR